MGRRTETPIVPLERQLREMLSGAPPKVADKVSRGRDVHDATREVIHALLASRKFIELLTQLTRLRAENMLRAEESFRRHREGAGEAVAIQRQKTLPPQDLTMDERRHVNKRRIASLSLSPTTESALAAQGVRTVGRIRRLSEDDLLMMRNIGDIRLREIRLALGRIGLKIGDLVETH
jgi:hypothetical protein